MKSRTHLLQSRHKFKMKKMKKDSLLAAFKKHELAGSEVTKLIGGNEPLQVYTIVGYDGGGTSNSTFDVQCSNGSTSCGWPDVLCGTNSPVVGSQIWSSIAC